MHVRADLRDKRRYSARVVTWEETSAAASRAEARVVSAMSAGPSLPVKHCRDLAHLATVASGGNELICREVDRWRILLRTNDGGLTARMGTSTSVRKLMAGQRCVTARDRRSTVKALVDSEPSESALS